MKERLLKSILIPIAVLSCIWIIFVLSISKTNTSKPEEYIADKKDTVYFAE